MQPQRIGPPKPPFLLLHHSQGHFSPQWTEVEEGRAHPSWIPGTARAPAFYSRALPGAGPSCMLNRLFKELFASNPGSPLPTYTPAQSHLKSRRQLEVAGQQVKTPKKGKRERAETEAVRFILGPETHGTPIMKPNPWKPAGTQRQQERKTNTLNFRNSCPPPQQPPPLSPYPSPSPIPSPCPSPLVPRPPVPALLPATPCCSSPSC